MRKKLIVGNWKMHGSHSANAELLAGVLEQRLQLARPGQVVGRLEVHAHEEEAGGVFAFEVAELLRIDDVAAARVEQAGYRVDDAGGVAARQCHDEFVFTRHGRAL